MRAVLLEMEHTSHGIVEDSSSSGIMTRRKHIQGYISCEVETLCSEWREQFIAWTTSEDFWNAAHGREELSVLILRGKRESISYVLHPVKPGKHSLFVE
jgi:hypothetical protein